MQHVDQIPRPVDHRARTGRRRAGDRPLRRLAAASLGRARALSRARGRARPELFPVRDHARATRPAALAEREAQQVELLARGPEQEIALVALFLARAIKRALARG